MFAQDDVTCINVPALAQKLRDIGDVALLIIDPIVSALTGDGHKNAETRRALQPLVDLGMRERCSILGITHFTKNTSGKEPLERITGSLAFGALARVVFVAAKEVEKPESNQYGRRFFLRTKSNIGPDDGGFVYDLEYADVPSYPGISSSAVQWGDAVDGTARDLLSEIEKNIDSDSHSPITNAKKFLAELLRNGPVPSEQVKQDADEAGHSWTTMKRAKDKLGIEAVKIGMKGKWLWQIPNTKNAKFAEESQ